MVVAKKRYNDIPYAVYGNHALDYDRDESFVVKKKITREELRKVQIKRAKKQLKLVAMVFLFFCAGMLIIGRYAFIINLNNQCAEIQKQITQNQKENENLKLEMLKYYNIKEIEEEATGKLSMVRPDGINTVYLDKGAMYSEDSGNEDMKDNSEDQGFFDMIASLFN